MRHSILFAFLALCAIVLPVALAHGGGEHGGVEERTLRGRGDVEPGDFAEVDFESVEGAAITYVVDAGEPVNVNIHEHQMGTVTHASHNATRSVSETFLVPHNGTFSIMVVNPGEAETQIEVVVSGPLALVGSTGLSLDKKLPGPGFVLVLAGVMLLLARGRRPA